MSDRRRGSGRSDVAIAFGVSLGLGITAAAAVALTQLAKGRRLTLTEQQWKEALDESLRVNGWENLLDVIRQGGIEGRLRKEVWPFLLKVFDPYSSAEQRAALYGELVRSYAELMHRCQDLETALESSVVRTGSGVAVAGNANPATSLPAHLVQFAEAQRIIVLDAIRTKLPPTAGERAGNGAASNSGRGEEPSSLTNGYPAGYSARQWGVAPWSSRVAQETLDSAGHLGVGEKAQASRLINLLSAYAVHDPETGYCQGMSDLAAPFLALLDDDALAFWCFAQLMQTARYNFRHDESGIRGQLTGLVGLLQAVDPVLYHRLRQIGAGECLFAYRMLVVMLRRELSLEQTMALWEILWAEAMAADLAGQRRAADPGSAAGGGDDGGPGVPLLGVAGGGRSAEGLGVESGEPAFLLFVVAAIMRSQRRAVLDEAKDVDDVLRIFATVKVDVWSALRTARTLQRTYQQSASHPHENGRLQGR